MSAVGVRFAVVAATFVTGASATGDFGWNLNPPKRPKSPEAVADKRSVIVNNWIEGMHALSDQKARRRGYYSQGAQDFYLMKIFDMIGSTNKFFVEYGFNEMQYEGGSGANSELWYRRGWRGLLLDAGNENKTINLRKHFLYSSNIAGLLKKYNVPTEFDFLSSDMDSHDLWVQEAILRAGYRPRVMLTEFNSNYNPDDAITREDSGPQDKFVFAGCAWGTSAGALRLVAEEYGYTLVGRVTWLDLIWVRNDLIRPEWNVPSYAWFMRDTKKGLHHFAQTDTTNLRKLVDYKTYLRTKDLEKAKKSARQIIRERNDMPCFAGVI